MGFCFLAEHHKHRDICKIWPCGTKFILFFSLYLAYKRISFYIKIQFIIKIPLTIYLSNLSPKMEIGGATSQKYLFFYFRTVFNFPMLLTEKTTNDTCQSNLRGAWSWRNTGTQRTKESPRVPPLYTLSQNRYWTRSVTQTIFRLSDTLRVLTWNSPSYDAILERTRKFFIGQT
jgi:hypothetical protein